MESINTINISPLLSSPAVGHSDVSSALCYSINNKHAVRVHTASPDITVYKPNSLSIDLQTFKRQRTLWSQRKQLVLISTEYMIQTTNETNSTTVASSIQTHCHLRVHYWTHQQDRLHRSRIIGRGNAAVTGIQRWRRSSGGRSRRRGGSSFPINYKFRKTIIT